MTEFDDFFKYIVTGGGAIIAYFFKSFHKGIKDQERKVERMDEKLSKVENNVNMIDSQYAQKIEQLEKMNKLQFDQLHDEIKELKIAISGINVSIQELLKLRN